MVHYNCLDGVCYLHQNKEEIKENILEIWTKDNQPYNRLKCLCFNNNELYVSIREVSYGSRTNHNQKSIQEVIDYLNDVRQRIISELSNKFDKEKIVLFNDVRDAYPFISSLSGKEDVYALFENDLPDTYNE